MVMAGFQIFNLVLLIFIVAVGGICLVMFLRVLFKLNKALDIWLEQNGRK